jgi:hypothetical protein
VTTTKRSDGGTGHSVDVDPARWQELFEELLAKSRVGSLGWICGGSQGVRAWPASDLPRKTCWTIAEHSGGHNPDGMQHLLARAARMVEPNASYETLIRNIAERYNGVLV